MIAYLRRLFTRSHAVDLSGECKHVWTNWSEPNSCTIVRSYPSYGGTHTPPKEMAGWSQERRCLKCNLFEPRLINGNGLQVTE